MTNHKLILPAFLFFSVLQAVIFAETLELTISLHTFLYSILGCAFLRHLTKSPISLLEKITATLLEISLLLFPLWVLERYDFSFPARSFVAVLLSLTFVFEFLLRRKSKPLSFQNMDENTLSFEDFRYLKQHLDFKAKRIKEVGEVVTFPFICAMMGEFRRNAAIRYQAKESLSDTYFENLEKSMSDPYVYLVFADTGSTASNFIGLLTNKPYNHLSISFDSNLKTLVSYNGGERVMPPGMNQEMIEWFYQKEDASIRVYRLPVTTEQKKIMADRIRKINREGSAYNLIGVAIGKSIQPNIMVCSEFVYGLLESVNANYFTKTALEVKPADMIELDYERKLEFVETIRLNTFCDVMVEKGKPLPTAGKPVKLKISS